MALSELLKSANWSEQQKKSTNDAFWALVLEGFTPAFIHLRKSMALSEDPQAGSLNVRTEYDSFYSKLWTAYEHRLLALATEMNFSLRFLFADKEDKFFQQGQLFIAQHSLDAGILTFLSQQRTSWQNKLALIRNKVIQHPQISHQEVSVIYTPAVAKTYFDYSWQTAEYLVAIMLSKRLPSWCTLAELPPELTENGRRIFALQIEPGMFSPTAQK